MAQLTIWGDIENGLQDHHPGQELTLRDNDGREGSMDYVEQDYVDFQFPGR